ncbi:hypothetical protein SISNIDRAFT_339849 [Sistotremastrum niveocremeum HHB9708]|uniref:Spc7 kinetochore protein domain-containing protein n=1 Tax=Sistotremastrum niveocremeum HHB9708 TaxID=1314777 RepID=A0A164XPD0_9AGAM|nr:hypothetical protein SISNIDRAFT_339849 [Sistotremastrum niveocremeum HHB9708]
MRTIQLVGVSVPCLAESALHPMPAFGSEFNTAKEGNTNSTEAPSSPAPSESEGAPLTPGFASSHASSSDVQRRFSGASFDGEESMELDDEDSQLYDPIDSHPANASLSDDDLSEDDDLMDATEVFGEGIIAQRRSSVHEKPRSSMPRASMIPRRARDSLAPPLDREHPVGIPLKEPEAPSQALLELQSCVSDSFQSHNSEDLPDMPIDEAVRRLSAVRSSILGESAGEQSFSTVSDDSMMEDRTVNLTMTRDWNEESNRIAPRPSIRSEGGWEADMSVASRITAHHSAQSVHEDDSNMSLDESDLDLSPRPDPPQPSEEQALSQTDPSPLIFSAPELEPHSSFNGSSPNSAIPSVSGAETATGISNFTPPVPLARESQGSSAVKENMPASAHFALPTRASQNRIQESLSPTKRRLSTVTTSVFSHSNHNLEVEGASVPSAPALAPVNKPTTQGASSKFRRPSGYSRSRKSISEAESVYKDSLVGGGGPSSTESYEAPEITDVHSQTLAVPSVKEREPTHRALPKGFSAEEIRHSPIAPVARLGGQAQGSSPIRPVRPITESGQNEPSAPSDLLPTVETPAISIEDFFTMTGVKFMDEITVPRKSIVRPTHLMSRRDSEGDSKPGLAQCIVAMNVDIPQLKMYAWVGSHMRKWIDESKATHRVAEEEVAKVTPAQFTAFAEADEQDRKEYTSCLKLIKACEQLRARATWYGWKQGWLAQLQGDSEQSLRDLDSDALTIKNLNRELTELMPSLQEQHALIMQELDAEKEAVHEIENSDQEYLEELKATIAEQNGMLEEYQSKVSENRATLERLTERLAEVTAQQQEATEVIADCRRKVGLQKNSTKAGVFRLKEELEVIQDLHLWETIKVQADSFEFIYGSNLKVIIPCKNYAPVHDQVEMSFLPNASDNHAEILKFRSLGIQAARAVLMNTCRAGSSIKDIVQCLSDCFAGLSQLLCQLRFLLAQFPLEITLLSDGSLTATVTLLLKRIRSKALVAFKWNVRALTSWPMSLNMLQCEVKVVYGGAK